MTALVQTAVGFLGELLGFDQAGLGWVQPPCDPRVARILWRRLLREVPVQSVPRSVLRALQGGGGAARDVAAAGEALAREVPVLGRWGKVGAGLSLIGGGAAYGWQLLASRTARQTLWEERTLLGYLQTR